jgi:uncharacterized NAD(P)/FAD-binding protein YdhS
MRSRSCEQDRCRGGVAGEMGWIDAADDDDVDAAGQQVTGTDVPVAAVVAGSADNEDAAAAARQLGTDDVGDGASGMLHQHDAGDAEPIDGVMVAGSRLRPGEQRRELQADGSRRSGHVASVVALSRRGPR